MMVVKPKTTQSVEPDEEPVDLFNLTGLIVQNFLSLLEHLFKYSRLNLNRSRSDQGAVEVQQSPVKH